MKKLVLVLAVMATVSGIAFAAGSKKKANKIYCVEGCGNEVSTDGAICSSCKQKKEEDLKKARDAARRYEAADNYCKNNSSYYDDCMKEWEK